MYKCHAERRKKELASQEVRKRWKRPLEKMMQNIKKAVEA